MSLNRSWALLRPFDRVCVLPWDEPHYERGTVSEDGESLLMDSGAVISFGEIDSFYRGYKRECDATIPRVKWRLREMPGFHNGLGARPRAVQKARS